jgi:hypothetical protein
MGNWHRLANFVSWSKKKFPAKHYMLIVYNHGSGWRSMGKSLRPVENRGISYDDENKNHITTLELPLVFKTAGSVDIYYADACRMQDLPSVYEIRDYADYIIGSQADVYKKAQDYISFMTVLTQNPQISPSELSKAAVKVFGNYYKDFNEHEFTLSVLNAKALDGIIPCVNSFIEQILKSPQDIRIAMELRKTTMRFTNVNAMDLVLYAKSISEQTESPALKLAAKNLIDYIDNELVIAKFNNELAKGAGGISFYVNYMTYFDKSFLHLSLAKDTMFPEMIKTFSAIDRANKN